MNQKNIERFPFHLGQIMQKNQLMAIPFISIAREQKWELNEVEAEIEKFASRSSPLAIFQANERNTAKKIIWYVNSELVRINFAFFELISKKQLTYAKLLLLLGALDKLSLYSNYLPHNLSTDVFLQTKRLESIAAEYVSYAGDPDFAVFITKPYSFWFSYSETEEFRQEFQSLEQLKAVIENHLQYWSIIRWIIELFSDIRQKICWYIHIKLDLLVDSLCKVDSNNALFSRQSHLESLNPKIKQLAEEYMRFREYFSTAQDKFISLELANCKRVFREYVNTDSDLDLRPILSASLFAKVISLSQDREKLENLISHCAGLMGIKMIGKSYRESFAEIIALSREYRHSTSGTTNYYWRKNSGEFMLVEDTHQLIKWLEVQGLLKDEKLQLLMEYARMFPSCNALRGEGDKKQNSFNNSFEEGSLAREAFAARSRICLDEVLNANASSETLGINRIGDSLVIFESFLEKIAFLEYLLKTYFSNKKIADSKSDPQTSEYKIQPSNSLFLDESNLANGSGGLGEVLNNFEIKEDAISETLEKLGTELEEQEQTTQKLEQKFAETSDLLESQFESGVQELFKRIAAKGKKTNKHLAEVDRNNNCDKSGEGNTDNSVAADENSDVSGVIAARFSLANTPGK